MSNFQDKVKKQYEEEGWLVIVTIRLGDNGYPDLFLFKDGTAIFIECKEEGDTLKPLQKFRINQLIKQGFEAFCLQDGKGQIYPVE